MRLLKASPYPLYKLDLQIKFKVQRKLFLHLVKVETLVLTQP